MVYNRAMTENENPCFCPDCDAPEWWGRMTDETMDEMDSRS